MAESEGSCTEADRRGKGARSNGGGQRTGNGGLKVL